MSGEGVGSMYCAPCRSERLGGSKSCAVCGALLVSRPKEAISAELMHVLWVLEEVPRWDVSVVPAMAQAYVMGKYRQSERVLRETLGERVEPAPVGVAVDIGDVNIGDGKTGDGKIGTAGDAARVRDRDRSRDRVRQTGTGPGSGTFTLSGGAQSAPESNGSGPAKSESESFSKPKSAPAPAPSPVAALFSPQPEPPGDDDALVEEASVWHRIWKPFLNESVGWFVGGFLILVGTLYWVADAWATMSGSTRSLTVFAFAAAWTLGFTAWSRFLARRESTRAAGRILELIAAAVAPLAPVALGPIAASAPAFFWPALVAWAAFTFFLGRSVSQSHDPSGAPWAAVAMALTSAVMGVSPLVSGSGTALWLTAAPLLAFVASCRRGPRQTRAQSTFAALAPLYLLVLFATRVHIAMVAADVVPNLWNFAPLFSLAACAALQLRREPSKALGIGVVSLQLIAAFVSVAADAPAFFVSSAVLFFTSRTLARRDARWAYPAYVGAYLAFQSCGQLVPSQLKAALAAVRVALNYSASQPLPAAYDAIYAAVFVIAVALYAWRKRDAILLDCTAWASGFVGALGLLSVSTDTRPVLLSAPFVAALCLVLGLSLARPWLTRVGVALVGVTAVALVFALGAVASSTAVGALALALAGLSVFALKPDRLSLSLGAGTLALLAVALAFTVSGGSPVAIALASAAALVVARNLDSNELLALAFFVPATLLPNLSGHDALGVALAVTGLALAFVSRRRDRGQHAAWASWSAALLAPVVQAAFQTESLGLLGVTLLLCALTMLVGRRSAFGDAVAIIAIGLAALPVGGVLKPIPFMTHALTAQLALVASLGASLFAARAGRSWRTVLVASIAVSLSGLAGLPLFAAVTALVASRALLPWLGVPLAALFALAGFHHGLEPVALAVAFSLIALFEENDFTWSHLLGKRQVAWPASLSALALLTVGCFTMPGFVNVSVAVVGSLCALVWVRATRFPFFAAAIPLLIAAVTNAAWPAALAIIVLTRVLQHVPAARTALLGTQHAARFLWVQHALNGALALLGIALVIHGEVDASTFAVSLLLAAGEPTWLRIAAAAGFAVTVPALALPAAAALLALAFLARHRPVAAQWVLGGNGRTWTVASAALSSLVCATFAVTAAPASLPTAAALAFCLFACAVLLGSRWLVSVAVPVLALPAALVFHPALSSTQGLTAAVVVLAAAALATVLRQSHTSARVLERLARMGRAFDGSVASPLWLGAALTLPVLLALGAPWPALTIAGAAVLLLTPLAWEAGVAAVLLGCAVALAAPQPFTSALLAVTGLLLCVAGMRVEKHHAVGRIWHHAGWLLAVAALALMPGLDSVGTPLAFAAVGGCGWCVVARKPQHEWLGWAATLVALHVGLFFAGLHLGHGQPHELILPWVALASVALGAGALTFRSSVQGYLVGIAIVVLGLLELLGAVVMLDGLFVREAVVAGVAAAIAVLALGHHALKRDDGLPALLAQLACVLGFVAVRALGFTSAADGTLAFAGLAFGAFLGALAGQVRHSVATTSRLGALVWPLVALLAAPFHHLWLVTLLLLLQSVHFAVLARGTVWKHRFATASTVAFNVALGTACLASGFAHPHFLLIPFGLSALVLLNLFRDDFAPKTLERLRAAAVTVIYAAAAFEPLAFNSVWGLALCALVCVVGIAIGIGLRVRSYVFLGTGFLVTSVVSSLTRYGIHEPRVGALLLSALGLLVVGFMVLFTTRRSELLERYQRARSMLAQWQG